MALLNKKDLLTMMAVFCICSVNADCRGGALCPETCECSPGGVNIDCQHRLFNKVPKWFPASASIIKLNANEITVLKNSSFAGCGILNILDLSSNEISSIEKNSFRDLQNLTHLYLQRNNIEFTKEKVPLGTFDPLVRLKVLGMEDNYWQEMQEIRDDIFKGKLLLKELSFDVPNDHFSFGGEFLELTSLSSLGIYGGLSHVNNDTFIDISKLPINNLTLRSVNLHYLDALAFSNFPHLTLLDLSNNNNLGVGKNLSQSWYGLRKSKLRVLNLTNIVSNFDYKSYALSSDFFAYLNKTPLRDLYLDVNGLTQIEPQFHLVFPKLEKLSLSYNRFFDYIVRILSDVYNLNELYFLDISMQSRYFNNHIIKANVGNRTDLNLLFHLPPKIRHMNMTGTFSGGYKVINNISWISNDTLHMQNLDLSGNKLDAFIGHINLIKHQPVQIDYLNLSGCEMKYCALNFFQSIFTVYSVDVSFNDLGQMLAKDTNGSTLHQADVAQVKELNAASNDIRSLSKNFFSRTTTPEKIILKDNSLNTWQCSIRTMPNLTLLDLSGNLIPYLEAGSWIEFDHIAKTNFFSLNLMNNPLECDCHSLDFLKWMSSTRVTIFNRDNYSCHMSGDIVSLRNLTEIIRQLTTECSSKTWVIITGVSCLILLFTIAVTAVVYRHRWDIRYWGLRFQRRRREYDILNDDRHFQFDTFVAYHQNELNWIMHQLIPKLEHCSNPIKLCIHHRDWLPGPTIEENVSYSVENSRKTLAVLSKSFLTSGWCEFEMEMARLRGFEEGKHIIVVVALEEIPMSSMSRTLANLRRTHSWLDWFEYENERDRFWTLLRRALRE